ncbi:hypothetical protein BURK_005297 [Burkholderia sp. SJ98]|uniref:hypothetical protein n=1 Tax=Caballeronia zhejiangensis TaxID=871203 RepID=UPI00025BA007|nr:hypothetical protein [Caballeronia zhejiangensis]EKS72430.1 hypothetical protein BURK_005297 [Burkholderia sp. SJ98]
MSTQEDVSAASAGLAGLLASMVNRPVTEDIARAVSDARFQIVKQIKESTKGVKGDLGQVIETFPRLANDLESVKEYLEVEIKKSSAALEERIRPRFAAIGTKQEEGARAIHAALEEAFADACARDERLDQRIRAMGSGLADTMNQHASVWERETAELLAQVVRLTGQGQAIHGDLDRLAGAVQEAIGKAQDDVHTAVARLETRVSDVKDFAAAMNEQANARLSDLTAAVVERVREFEASVAERSGTLESDVGALVRDQDEHRKATRHALAELTTAISVIGQGQKKLTKLAFAALGISTIAVIVLVADVLRSWPH